MSYQEHTAAAVLVMSVGLGGCSAEFDGLAHAPDGTVQTHPSANSNANKDYANASLDLCHDQPLAPEYDKPILPRDNYLSILSTLADHVITSSNERGITE